MRIRNIDTIISDIAHILDSNAKRKQHLLVASAGAGGTFLLWGAPLTHSDIFDHAVLRVRVSAMWLVLALAPPFIMTFGICNILFFKPATPSQDSGPMSGYLYQQESEKKWKIMVVSGIAAAAHFLVYAPSQRASVSVCARIGS